MKPSIESIKVDRTIAQAGDLALLVGRSHKHHIVRLKFGTSLQTHRGVIHHDDIIGLPWGSKVSSHLGRPFHLLEPSLADIILQTKRQTQILYPKDIGYILLKMGIGPGKRVLEAGSGSGGLTTALAYTVGQQGQVFSYEVRPDNLRLAKENLEGLGLADRVTFRERDIGDGFEVRDMDAVFLDLPNPYEYLVQVRQALKPGGFLGSILPTTNQIYLLLNALLGNDFAFIEVCEIMLRFYRADPKRFRPVDRMVAHTGYLIFARPILDPGIGAHS